MDTEQYNYISQNKWKLQFLIASGRKHAQIVEAGRTQINEQETAWLKHRQHKITFMRILMREEKIYSSK